MTVGRDNILQHRVFFFLGGGGIGCRVVEGNTTVSRKAETSGAVIPTKEITSSFPIVDLLEMSYEYHKTEFIHFLDHPQTSFPRWFFFIISFSFPFF
jgi:hypothetical protein